MLQACIAQYVYSYNLIARHDDIYAQKFVHVQKQTHIDLQSQA